MRSMLVPRYPFSAKACIAAEINFARMLCRACSRRETRGLPRRTGLVLTGFFLAAADFMSLMTPLDPLIACHNRRTTMYKNRSLPRLPAEKPVRAQKDLPKY